MSERKKRREIDNAIKHLLQYTGPNGEWEGLFQPFYDEMLSRPAKVLGYSIDDVYERVCDGLYEPMLFGTVFEEFATAYWDSMPHSLVDAYLKHRGWREGPAGREYLRELAASNLQLLEVTDVEPGIWIELKPYCSQKKSVRVFEKSGSETIKPWDAILGRIIKVGGKRGVTGGILHFKPEVAARVHELMEEIPGDIMESFDELIAEGELSAYPDDIEQQIYQFQREQLVDIAIDVWITQIIIHSDRPQPSIHNHDGDDLELIELKFQLETSKDKIAEQLDHAPIFERDDQASLAWVWLCTNGQDRSDLSVAIQGLVQLDDNYLTIETNSRERAETCKTMIGELLGSHVGRAIAVYKNLDAIDSTPSDLDDRPEMTPEILEAVNAHLDSHYRQTLDEPIPMLEGYSPRECAADPRLQHLVITWLKHLENSDARSPNENYDFGWIWQELGLKRHFVP